MMLSMTGFGKSEAEYEQKKILIEIRTLNSKNIDLNFRTPHSYRDLESDLRKKVHQVLIRGKIDVYVFVDYTGVDHATTLNKSVLQGYLNQLQEIQAADPLEHLKMAIRMPDVLKTEKEAIDDKEKKAVLMLLENCLKKVQKHRADEGAALEKDFNLRLTNLQQLLDQVKAIDPDRTKRVNEKLRLALAQLAIEIDKNRMEQELIYYLEKYDITEEKVRLKNHIAYFKEIMDQQQSNGKKLGFIAQEMGREINTIGSKANHAELQKIVVQMKDELEKIKEQLLNVL